MMYPLGYIHESYFRSGGFTEPVEFDNAKIPIEGFGGVCGNANEAGSLFRTSLGANRVLLKVIPAGEFIYVVGFPKGSWQV